MRKRSQIFLLLTILVIAFIVGISTTLIDLRKTPYNEPAPQSKQFYQNWDNTLQNIEEILVFSLAQHSANLTKTVGEMQSNVTNKLMSVENYLLSRGFSAKITLLTTLIENVNYQKTVDNVTAPTMTQYKLTNIGIAVHLETTFTSLNQELEMNILFHAENNDSQNFCEVYKIINGKREEIVNAKVTAEAGIVFTNQGLGQYNYIGTGEYSIVSPEGVAFLNLKGT